MDQLAFSCSLTAVLLHRVRRAAGDDAQQALLHAAGSPRTLEYLMDLGNWVSYDEVIALWEAGAELTGDPQFARHIGEDFVGRLAGSGNSAVLRQLGSPEGLVRKIALAGHRFSTAADLAAAEVREGYVLERPERLGSTLELVDRLSGVAAHAVTALENGRLVDHITFQARHDQLTGA